jgi:CRISPR/Cas system CSM-associated protein Csm3 (group 7 of RAMP superfamily)
MSGNKFKLFDRRYVASILIEAETPLKISTGEKDLLSDSAVMADINGLPIIPGTSLCGVLSHSLHPNEVENEKIFGYQKENSTEGIGSRVIVSDAHFVGKDGKVLEGFEAIDWNDDFFGEFKNLPIRQHAKISHKGAVDKMKRGKFDEQVVYKGTRFVFEIELIGQTCDEPVWNEMIDQFASPVFRIGGGTRKGFGKLKVIAVFQKCFDLNTELNQYLEKTSSLNDRQYLNNYTLNEVRADGWKEYKLELTPEDLWLFGSGLSDGDVDMTPVYEKTIIWWENDKPGFSNQMILIPASSVKGAISHRVAFHYNKLSGVFADELEKEQLDYHVGENNEAVKQLFGYAIDSKKISRGGVIVSDVFLEVKEDPKVLNHVAIDRFTGGAIDGALFDEKAIKQKTTFGFSLLVNKEAIEDQIIKQAIEDTLNDICNGMLPLGGGVMRGHGCFTGTIVRGEK